MSAEIRLSVTIITRNEAHRIERCLRSVAFADECVVLDSGSTDDTMAIARRCGARVESTGDWPGFGLQKNRAVALARGQWIFSIDADEEASEQLGASIRSAIAAPDFDGYWARRISSFCGRTIRFGDWRRDRVLRVFRKSAGKFSNDVVHERVIVAEPHGELSGWLVHESVESYEDGRQKMLRYARLGAARLRDQGKGGLTSALVHGGWTFVRGYLLRLGFLDGRYGLSIARLNAEGTYLRYRLAGRPQSAVESGDLR